MNMSSRVITSPFKGAMGCLVPPRSTLQLLVRFESENKSPYGHQLGGYEHKPESFGAQNKWRKSFEERGFWTSKLAAFSNKSFKADRFMKLNPDNFKYMDSFDSFWRGFTKEKLLNDQEFCEPRLAILGPDLAAAHFTIFRGGAIKFYHSDKWFKDDTKLKEEYDDDLPNNYDANYVVEGVDISDTAILYEGLVNLQRLRKLKLFIASKCGHFDNWCLDKISSEYSNSLEYLDISYTNVSYSGLNALYRFKNLKTLVLDDMADDVEYFKMCSELKKCFPDLTIEGISPQLIQLDEDDCDSLKSVGSMPYSISK